MPIGEVCFLTNDVPRLVVFCKQLPVWKTEAIKRQVCQPGRHHFLSNFQYTHI